MRVYLGNVLAAETELDMFKRVFTWQQGLKD